MTTKITVNNLPADTTEDELRELFAQWGTDVETVKLITAGDPDDVSAVVTMELDKITAQVMAAKSQDFWWKGRKLDFYIPLFSYR